MEEYQIIDKLKNAQGELGASFESKANVIGTGIGKKIISGTTTHEWCIQALVTEKKPLDELEPGDLIPGAVETQGETIRTDVIAIGELTKLGVRDRTRPAQGGNSLSPDNRSYSGTLGGRVINNINDQLALLTNNHVAADENTLPIGAAMVQPSIPDGGVNGPDEIATLTRFVPIVFNTTASNRVDAAVCDLINDTKVGADLYSEGAISPITKAPEIGLLVKKVGRTTETTLGRVISINATVLVNYSSGLARFVGQIITTHMSIPGDSGSLLVSHDQNQPVGLLFAGSDFVSVCNPIADVMSQLNVRFGNVGNFNSSTLIELKKPRTNTYQYRLEPLDGVDGFVRVLPNKFRVYTEAGSGFTAQYVWHHRQRDDYSVGPLTSALLLPQYSNVGLLGYTADNSFKDPGVDTVELKELFNLTTRKHKLLLSNEPFVQGQDGFYIARSLGYVRIADAALPSAFLEKQVAEFRRAGTFYYSTVPVQWIGNYIRQNPDRFTMYTEAGDGFSAWHLWYSARVRNYVVAPSTFSAILPGYVNLGLIGFTAINANVDPSPDTEELLEVFNLTTKRHKLIFASDFTQGQGGFYRALSLGYIRRAT